MKRINETFQSLPLDMVRGGEGGRAIGDVHIENLPLSKDPQRAVLRTVSLVTGLSSTGVPVAQSYSRALSKEQNDADGLPAYFNGWNPPSPR